MPGETLSHDVPSSQTQAASAPKTALIDIRLLIDKLEIDLVALSVGVRKELEDLVRRVSILERRECALETWQDLLEGNEKVLEERENQLANFGSDLEEKPNDVQVVPEGVRGTHTSQGRVLTIEEDLIARHQGRRSAMIRKRQGVTVDVLEVEADELYHFDESTWDIAIFIGTPSLGVGGSSLTCIALLMNVLVQVVFTGIVWFNFAESSINQMTLDGALAWRTGIAHQYQFLDSDTSPSLVARVCGGDLSLQIATAQINMYEDVSDYLKPEASGIEAIFDGKLMCLVALVCWFLMVSKEVHKAVDLFRAVLCVPRGPDKLEPLEIPLQPTRYIVATMSMSRVVFSTSIVVYRLVLSVVLAYCGTYFLVYTIQITELVLNAVALEIILNIDDLLFDVVTTVNARHLLMRLQAMKMQRWPHCRGIDLKAVGMAVTIPVVTILIYLYMVNPMVQDLKLLSENLCGGNRNYVYSENPLRMVVMAPTAAFGTLADFPANASVRELALQEAIGQETLAEREASSYAIWAEGAASLQIMNELSFEQLVDFAAGRDCRDRLGGPLLHYVRDTMQDSSILTCADVHHWCTSLSDYHSFRPDGGRGIMARFACPQTCGCDNPASPTLYTVGCPSMCTNPWHAPYRASLVEPSSCIQQENVSNTSTWLTWVDQVRAYGTFVKSPTYEALADAMLMLGCDVAGLNSCHWLHDDAPLKYISHLCPESCRCWTPTAPPNCPYGCVEPSTRGPSQG